MSFAAPCGSRLSASALPSLVDLIIARAKRTPYFDLADYMGRFWLREHNAAKSNWAMRVHHIKRSDRDRVLHDHPWKNVSILMRGGYWEVLDGEMQRAVENGFEGAAPHLQALYGEILVAGGRELKRSQRAALRAAGVCWRGRCAVVVRDARLRHRLIVPKGRDAWSIFIMGPKVQEWGFHTRDGWVHNEAYTAQFGRDA